MKKSLIALAVMAAAGAASAQSSVQIYGLADVWFGSFKEGVGANAVRDTKIESGGVDTSRVGLKGSEDLGGGLKAIFTLEKAFAVDSGSADGGFDREASVGLAGSFGEVKVGRVWTAFDDLNDNASAVFASNALKPSAYVFASHNYNANPANGVRYTTPTIAGFTGTVSYAFGENKTATTSADNAYSLALKYENGPLMLGAAYQREEGATISPAIYANVAADYLASLVGPVTVQDVADSLAFAQASLADASVKYTRLNATYDFGVAKLLGSYGRVKDNSGYKTTEYQIGVDVPLSSNLILSGGYAHSKDKDNGLDDGKRTGFAVGVAYLLSKRTTVYAGFNNSKEEDAAGVDTNKTKAYAVGIRHTF